MPFDLQKHTPVELAKADPQLKKIRAGLGWDESLVNGHKVDCDVSVFLLDAAGKLPADEFLIFYNNLKSPDGAVTHKGDSLDGEGAGDDENVSLDLSKIDSRIEFVYFTVTIHDAEARDHHFGNVKNAYIKLYNEDGGAEICSYNLPEAFDGYDSLLIATLSRNGGSWQVEAEGKPFGGGLGALVDMYQ